MNLAMVARSVLGAAALAALAVLGVGCANSGGDPATCDPACPTFYMCCDGTGGVSCRNIVNDPDNCGGCGITCPSRTCREAACVAGPAGDGGMIPGTDSSIPTGDCRPSCSSNERCCGTSCVGRMVAPGADGRSDPSFSNCNGCGIACDMNRASACSVPGGGSGAPRCMCGVYDQCGAGQVCVSEAGTFACVSTSTDPNNCGSVGNRCATGESCVAGVCACGSAGASCSAGQACCGGSCIDSQSDPMNCGGCGMACGDGETCTAGSCGCGTSGVRCTAPMAGMFGMGGTLGQSCCDGACVANSDTSCGCGVACDATADETCQVGGDLLGMGMGPAEVCCGDETVAFLGCGGGLPFP